MDYEDVTGLQLNKKNSAMHKSGSHTIIKLANDALIRFDTYGKVILFGGQSEHYSYEDNELFTTIAEEPYQSLEGLTMYPVCTKLRDYTFEGVLLKYRDGKKLLTDFSHSKVLINGIIEKQVLKENVHYVIRGDRFISKNLPEPEFMYFKDGKRIYFENNPTVAFSTVQDEKIYFYEFKCFGKVKGMEYDKHEYDPVLYKRLSTEIYKTWAQKESMLLIAIKKACRFDRLFCFLYIYIYIYILHPFF